MVIIEEQEIQSVSDLLSIIGRIEKKPFGSYSVSSMTFYRGQSVFDWQLKPSIFRDALYEKETYMIKKIKHLAEVELDNLDRFSQLVKLQHYGLPTRLLDLTENPLVALYFACSDPKYSNNDGALYVFNNHPTAWSDSILVETYMDFVFNLGFDNIDVEYYLKKSQIKNKQIYSSRREYTNERDLIHDLGLEGGFAVYPKQNNNRIRAQQGAFFLFGSHFDKVSISDHPGNSGKRYLKFDSNINEEAIKNVIKVRVKSSAKNQILNDLSLMGINRMMLFPELDNLVSNVVEDTEKELNDF